MNEIKRSPGFTVGQLRQALDALDPEMVVTVRFAGVDGDDQCGGVLFAGIERAHDEEETVHFAIDATDDDDAFEDEATDGE